MHLPPEWRHLSLSSLTFSPHAHLKALLEPAVLALVAVVLVNWAAPTPPALVGQVAPHGTLEEALATWGQKKRQGCQ